MCVLFFLIKGVESVMGNDSTYIHNAMKNFPRPVFIYHNPCKPTTARDGVYTDPETKHRMVRHLSHELAVQHVVIVSKFVRSKTFGNAHLEYDPTIIKILTEVGLSLFFSIPIPPFPRK